MKKYVTLLALICVFFSACSVPEESVSNSKTALTSSEAVSSPIASVLPETSSEDLPKPPEANDPMAISNLFSDPHFAYYIADLFGKDISDTVTYEELAAFDGVISIGPGEIRSIEGIGYLTGITGFESAKNNLEELPDELGQCLNIKYINLLKSYSLKKITPEIGKLKKLKILRADLTELTELPQEIGNCTELEVLILDNTAITSIPEELGNCAKLKYLDIHRNNISILPDSLSRLSELEMLDVGYLEINNLFNDIENLKNLKILNASSNSINILPRGVCSLEKLERLDLFGWNLKSLPEELKNLKNLKYLNVYDNFSLNEDYKRWFDKTVYSCENDPEKDRYWFDMISPEMYQ